MQRRDIRQERHERAEERRRERWSAKRDFRALERERLFVQAEDATKGYMLNRRGIEAGVDPKSLFTGPESRARKYASWELLQHWETSPRPTEAYFQGQQTRVASAGQFYNVGRRVTSEEAEWRDRWERYEWEIETGLRAA